MDNILEQVPHTITVLPHDNSNFQTFPELVHIILGWPCLLISTKGKFYQQFFPFME